ncbi:MAG: squalene/phytoene synthase family protein [Pseudomonadota bacterium]
MEKESAYKVMARHARSFTPASWLLARPDRERIARLYTLCRCVDDLADIDGSVAAATRLANVSAEVRFGSPKDSLAIEALSLFENRPRARDAFVRLVDGVQGDIGAVAIPDKVSLERYCQAVAGTVGIMVCELFEVGKQHHAAASSLGRAMQLTNICRDVLEDAHAGRRYLPGDLCPLSADQIAYATLEARKTVRNSVRYCLTEAEGLYDIGIRTCPSLPLRLRLAVIVAAALYRDIGRSLLRTGGDPMLGRARLHLGRKIWVALLALARTTLWGRCTSRVNAHA